MSGLDDTTPPKIYHSLAEAMEAIRKNEAMWELISSDTVENTDTVTGDTVNVSDDSGNRNMSRTPDNVRVDNTHKRRV